VSSTRQLYELWRQAASCRSSDLALWDVPSGRRWTFTQLARDSENPPPSEDHGICHPMGTGAEFVLDLLRGWRAGLVTCPLEHPSSPSLPAALPKDCAHLKLTSATTGAARAVAFSADQLLADAAHIMEGMRLRSEWANVATISLAHSYGFSSLVLLLLFHGMPLILAGGGLPEQLRTACASMNNLVLPSVPALWRTWLEAGVIPENVRVAISAGAPLPVALEQLIFERHGLKIHNFYGSTECGGIAYDASETPREDANLVGTILPSVQVSLNQQGCVQVRGPNVGLTYYPDPEPTLCHGIFQTRDLGRLEGNALFLLGRASDQINVAGRKVSPEAIEQVLRNHPAVRECVVFGVADQLEHRGEAIVAALALRTSDALSEVRQHAQSRLPSWQWPKHWWLVDDLTPNDRGKISRSQWAERFLKSTGPATLRQDR